MFSQDPTPAVRPLSRPDTPSGLAAFMDGLIDYAGLFPPAGLPLEEALPNFAAYSRAEDRWMLGHFICPAARLAELTAFTDLFPPDQPLPVSVLGSGGTDADTFLRSLGSDLRAIADFRDAHPGRVRADVLEVRLPTVVTEVGSEPLRTLLARTREAIDGGPARIARVHFEVAFTGDWRQTIDGSVGAMARTPAGGATFGFKVRCGGLTPDAFPTPEQLAHVLFACRDARVPFKATAGLHHPVRFLDRHLEVVQHGFLNVFGAAVLAHALELSEQALRQVVRSEQPKAFTFDDDGFAFQDLRITTEQVRAARKDFALSFGSCSFDEPRDDLRAMGLL
jgi:hypothetical protein